RQTHPHLVLMDVQMPLMDGLQVTSTLREEECLSGGHTPVIALTAGVLPEEKTKCYEAGMDDFLTKPLSYEKLRVTLAKFLKNGGMNETDSFILTDEAAAVNLLGKVMNDPALFIRISSQFESDSLSLLALMKEAINTRNSEALTNAAHACKGILNALEAKDAFLAASRLEDMGRQMTFTDAEKTYLQLESIITAMNTAFEAHRKQLLQTTTN
ncbi:MAG: response regulator, partial [Bacillota bacterium]|nr:response regulator [Bacillota bacterium]